MNNRFNGGKNIGGFNIQVTNPILEKENEFVKKNASDIQYYANNEITKYMIESMAEEGKTYKELLVRAPDMDTVRFLQGKYSVIMFYEEKLKRMVETATKHLKGGK